MNINEFFDLVIQVKEKMTECYREISKLCQNESISKDLMMLSKDETDHKNLLITGKNYLKKATDVFSQNRDRVVELKIGLNRAIRIVDNIHNNNIDLKKAINDAAELERLFEQFHLDTIAEVKDSSLKKLFKALSTDDKVHNWRLVKILTSFYRQT